MQSAAACNLFLTQFEFRGPAYYSNFTRDYRFGAKEGGAKGRDEIELELAIAEE